MTRPDPTLAARIATLNDAGEIEGFTDQLRRDGGLTVEAQQTLATRAAELQIAQMGAKK